MDFLSSRRTEETRPLIENRLGNNMISRLMNNNSRQNIGQQLDEVIGVDKDIQIFQQNSLRLLNPKVLYSAGIFSQKAQLYKHYREEQMCVIKNSHHLSLISSDSTKEILRTNMNLMHMGLIVIGIKGLTKKNLGTKVLITIYDDRWSDPKRSILGLTEVDMTNNDGIFYCSPDFMINSAEFGQYIKVGFQTKGYEDMNGGNNLLVCLGFIGKLSSNSNTRFKLKVDDVVELMGNQGIKVMKPLKIDPETYAGLEWSLELPRTQAILKPTEHLIILIGKEKHQLRL